jgi:hypothetical protein
MNTLNDDGHGKSKVLMDLDDVVPMGSNPRVRHGDEAMEHMWMLKFSAPNGPRIDPRTGWTRAKFVCGDVETKTLLQVW